MGKDKDKKKRRRDSSSSEDSGTSGSSDDERQHKKHKHKDKDKDKHKKKSKHKKHKSKDREDDMVAKAKAFLKNALASGQQVPGADKSLVLGGPGGGGAGAARHLPPTLPAKERITEDDYFTKNVEYRAWLQEEKKLLFNELTSGQTHDLFQDFVGLWNAERLAPRYYRGEVEAPTRLSNHKWNIKGAGKEDYKKYKATEKEALDELLGPKATGREAILEKKLARREAKKAAQRAAAHGVSDATLAAAQAKEQAQMAQFKALLAQGPITIPKRQ